MSYFQSIHIEPGVQCLAKVQAHLLTYSGVE